MKKIISVLLTFALALSVSLSASAVSKDSQPKNLTGEKIEYYCYKISSNYYFQVDQTGKWYRYGTSNDYMRPAKEGGMELVPYIREFNTENYYSGNDTQTVVYEGKTYTVDCKNQVSYLDGVVDEATTEIVKNIFADAKISCRALVSGKNTYIPIPFCKVVIKNEFSYDVYAFEEKLVCGGWSGNIVNEVCFNIPFSITYGDANVDGTINLQDVVEIQKSIANLKNDVFVHSADVIADKKVDMKDAVAVQRSIAGL